MNVISRLRRDHTLLRDELHVLECVLDSDITGSRQILRDVCARLSVSLRAHIQREGRLAVVCSRTLGTFGTEVLARLAVEHYSDQQYLQVIKRGIAREDPNALQNTRYVLASFLTGLRRHMDEQESELFPFLQTVLETSEESAEEPAVQGFAINEGVLISV